VKFLLRFYYRPVVEQGRKYLLLGTCVLYSYNEAMEGNPMDGRKWSVQGFIPAGCCCIPLWPDIIKIKLSVTSEGYMNRMTR